MATSHRSSPKNDPSGIIRIANTTKNKHVTNHDPITAKVRYVDLA